MSTNNAVFKDYPYWPPTTLEHALGQIEQITRTRKDDIAQISNLKNIFVSGRKVGRVPSASNDVIAGDKVGDFNVTATYAYYLIDNAGAGEWRRVAVASW